MRESEGGSLIQDHLYITNRTGVSLATPRPWTHLPGLMCQTPGTRCLTYNTPAAGDSPGASWWSVESLCILLSYIATPSPWPLLTPSHRAMPSRQEETWFGLVFISFFFLFFSAVTAIAVASPRTPLAWQVSCRDNNLQSSFKHYPHTFK